MGFDVLYDDASKLYWLVSNQMTDSMTRADKLPSDRRGLPCEERQGATPEGIGDDPRPHAAPHPSEDFTRYRVA